MRVRVRVRLWRLCGCRLVMVGVIVVMVVEVGEWVVVVADRLHSSEVSFVRRRYYFFVFVLFLRKF